MMDPAVAEALDGYVDLSARATPQEDALREAMLADIAQRAERPRSQARLELATTVELLDELRRRILGGTGT